MAILPNAFADGGIQSIFGGPSGFKFDFETDPNRPKPIIPEGFESLANDEIRNTGTGDIFGPISGKAFSESPELTTAGFGVPNFGLDIPDNRNLAGVVGRPGGQTVSESRFDFLFPDFVPLGQRVDPNAPVKPVGEVGAATAEEIAFNLNQGNLADLPTTGGFLEAIQASLGGDETFDPEDIGGFFERLLGGSLSTGDGGDGPTGDDTTGSANEGLASLGDTFSGFSGFDVSDPTIGGFVGSTLGGLLGSSPLGALAGTAFAGGTAADIAKNTVLSGLFAVNPVLGTIASLANAFFSDEEDTVENTAATEGIAPTTDTPFDVALQISNIFNEAGGDPSNQGSANPEGATIGALGGLEGDTGEGSSSSGAGSPGPSGGGDPDAGDSADPSGDPGGDGDGGDDGGDPKIICSMMNQMYGFGTFRNNIWLSYQAKIMPEPEWELGYHKLFLPLVRMMPNKPIVRAALEYWARQRTISIRRELHGRRITWKQWLLRKPIEALFFIVGRLIKLGILKQAR